MKPALSALLLISASGSVAAAQSPPGIDADNVRTVIVYGEDPCPRGTGGDIVICSRRPETERLRIPENVREDVPSTERESWTEKAERLEMMGRTGIASCSPVGPGAGSGCLLELIKQAREEQDAQAAEEARRP